SHIGASVLGRGYGFENETLRQDPGNRIGVWSLVWLPFLRITSHAAGAGAEGSKAEPGEEDESSEATSRWRSDAAFLARESSGLSAGVESGAVGKDPLCSLATTSR
ncbi:hypothetical protein N9L68_05745, partial [bacterium]|nr:hypothetical protein [bacterium]